MCKRDSQLKDTCTVKRYDNVSLNRFNDASKGEPSQTSTASKDSVDAKI